MNKHDSKTTSPLDNFDFSQDIGDHPLIQWLTRHRQTILYAFLAAVAVIVLAVRFVSNQASNAESAYLKADMDFARFQDPSLAVTEPAVRDEAFLNLQATMKRYPDLNAKYDGLIAESLIIDGKVDEAEQYAQRSFARTQHDDSPFYIDFAKTSLLISKKSYETAYQQAKALQEKMVEQASIANQNGVQLSFGPTLFALNLVRVAMLQQQLGDKEGELKAWEALQQFTSVESMKTSPFENVELRSVLTLFNEGHATIWKYVENRIRILSQN